jgi:hypothetical protein
MRIFQRFEVWLLLIVGGIAVWWSMKAPEPYAQSESEVAATMAESAVLRIHRCTLERDFGNARLDIEFRYRNTSPRPLAMQPPDVRLLTADGREVAPFILPSERPVSVLENSSTDLLLRYWLDAKDLDGTLRLEVRGQSVEVKSGERLDITKLENKKPKTWTTTKWGK